MLQIFFILFNCGKSVREFYQGLFECSRACWDQVGSRMVVDGDMGGVKGPYELPGSIRRDLQQARGMAS